MRAIAPDTEGIDGLLAELEGRIPDLRQVMLAALKNVRPSHLYDRDLWALAGVDGLAARGTDLTVP